MRGYFGREAAANIFVNYNDVDREEVMRNSNLLRWAHKQNDKGNKNWIHPPDTLQKGHIAYLVKFMGSTEVDQPKGIEVVKEGIRKLQFNQQLKKSEGTKMSKVELTISIDGVAIQEPKTKRIMHQYPLHRISYCADDKGEKKFFSFIAKEGADSEKHMCFVFVSDKLAEEITLTIGQAFELAYKRFLETSGKELEVQRRVMMLQQRVNQLEAESSALRQRLSDVLNGQANDLDSYMRRNKITNMLVVDDVTPKPSEATNGSASPQIESNGLLVNFNEAPISSPPLLGPTVPPVPPRSFERSSPLINESPAVGTKLEGLLMDELDDFNPRAFENSHNNNGSAIVNGVSSAPPVNSGLTFGQTLFNSHNNNIERTTPTVQPPLLAPPPRPNGAPTAASRTITAPAPTKPIPPTEDPFGMGDFGSNGLETAIGLLDKRILEMKDGFSRGLTFGNEDFSIESLDPLRK
ncbi:hypothetical protein GE061_002244 [Apolygus lucorum]|uniref:PID domain-containing protein n=1 Tax=Apolygus lucorum TaxID=248454 RepID=A0A8S9X754_APOLU|nr:hypothetical protein GE061_002244 [Apolygus lucorum]